MRRGGFLYRGSPCCCLRFCSGSMAGGDAGTGRRVGAGTDIPWCNHCHTVYSCCVVACCIKAAKSGGIAAPLTRVVLLLLTRQSSHTAHPPHRHTHQSLVCHNKPGLCLPLPPCSLPAAFPTHPFDRFTATIEELSVAALSPGSGGTCRRSRAARLVCFVHVPVGLLGLLGCSLLHGCTESFRCFCL